MTEIIERIEHIGNAGIFNNWRWTEGCQPLHPITLVYGANGSGKSTLASVLARAGTEAASPDGLIVQTRQGPVRGDDLDAALWRRVRVFNAEYVRLNLGFEDAHTGALLTVGAGAVEREERLTSARDLLRTTEGDLSEVAERASTATTRVEKLLEQTARRVRDYCEPHLSGYGGTGFTKATVRKLLEKQTDLARLVGYSERAEVLPDDVSEPAMAVEHGRLSTRPQARVDIGSLPGTPWNDRYSEVVRLLGEQPAVVVIAGFAQNPEAASWAQHGLVLHNEREQCWFCEAALDSARIAALAGHFNDEFTRVQQQISELIERLKADQRATASAHARVATEMQSLLDAPSEVIDRWSAASASEITGVETFVDAAIAALETKHASPLASITPPDVAVPAAADSAELVSLFDSHNTAIESYDAERIKTGKRIEARCVLAISDRYRELRSEAAEAEGVSSRLATECRELKTRVSALESVDDGDPRPFAEELTRDVASLLGREELRFEVVGKQYRITRHGESALKLSEGERNAIALLHFLKSLEQTTEAHRVPRGGWIVVIDDPVSSLDSGAIIGVSMTLQDRLVAKELVAQVVLITHSADLLRHWVQACRARLMPNRTGTHSAVVVELRTTAGARTGGSIKRVPRVSSWPPTALASKLGSEYRYLFWRLATELDGLRSPDASLESRVDAFAVVPNLARRLLEGFLSFYSPQLIGNLTDQATDVFSHEPADRRRRLTALLHHHSHHEDFDPHASLDAGEAVSTLDDLFRFMHGKEPGHVQRMAEAVGVDDLPWMSSLVSPPSRLAQLHA